MPLPTLEFKESEEKGLPSTPVPVRYACMVANWDPALFAAVVLGQMNEGYPLLTVYTPSSPKGIQPARKVPPEDYAKYLQLDGQPRKQQLENLPPDHFVWSDDLVWAYSDYIDLTVGRDSAHETGLGLRWRPALGDCTEVVKRSDNLS